MTIKSIADKLVPDKIEIDLTGPDGNAYVLLGMAKRLCEEFNVDWTKVQTEMMASDYDNLVETMDRYFGSVITLYR